MTKHERRQQALLLSLLTDVHTWLDAHKDRLTLIDTYPFLADRVEAALVEHGIIGQDPIKPGAAGTVLPSQLDTARMGAGEGKAGRIIQNGRLFRYVGIGWVEERAALQKDADTCPVVVYPEPKRETALLYEPRRERWGGPD